MSRPNKSQFSRVLTEAQEEQFLRNGFVKLERAFPKIVAEEACAILWRESGYDPGKPVTWTRPVVRIGDCAQPPFREAANTPASSRTRLSATAEIPHVLWLNLRFTKGTVSIWREVTKIIR